MTFSERVEVIRRARSLDMDPDAYTRSRRAWQRYEWDTVAGVRGAVEVPQVPRVWNEDND